jgi:hypothetical protein
LGAGILLSCVRDAYAIFDRLIAALLAARQESRARWRPVPHADAGAAVEEPLFNKGGQRAVAIVPVVGLEGIKTVALVHAWDE